MNKKMKVGVLYGGISSEREVSINTGKQISKKLNRDKYEVYEILLNEKKDVFKCEGMDFVFIALHGSFGEDGKVQSILETLDIKYNGCDFFTSSICLFIQIELVKKSQPLYFISKVSNILCTLPSSPKLP